MILGNLNFARLQRFLTNVSCSAAHTPNPLSGRAFVEYDKLTSETIPFMSSTKTAVKEEFYSSPDMEKPPKYIVRCRPGDIGASTYICITELIDKNTDQVHVQKVDTMVCIDKVSKSVTRLPKWWRQRYQKLKSDSTKLQIHPLNVPANPDHVYTMKVLWNDIDDLGHTNFVAYTRFCFDAAMDAVYHEKLTNFFGDIFLYNTREMESLYRGESRAGDQLVITCWENEDDPWVLHFDIKKDDTDIFQATINFFDFEASSTKAFAKANS